MAKTALTGAIILVAGFFLAGTADALAEKSGISAGLVGMILLALATGLPELSTTLSAARIGRYDLALGNIFGTNLWNMAIIALGDLFYTKGVIFEEAGKFELIAIFRAIAITGIVLLGLLERKDKVLFRMGYDSIAVIFVYFGGLFLLFSVGGSGK